jgi:hypothetical protein
MNSPFGNFLKSIVPPGTPSRQGRIPGRDQEYRKQAEREIDLEDAGQRRRDRISARAKQIYQALGNPVGRDLDNWLQAEREIDRQGG